jgi:hypothetical protein
MYIAQFRICAARKGGRRYCERPAANKLIVDPEALKAIRAAVAALDAKPVPAPELTKEPAAAEPMPAKVRAFWEHQERALNSWEIESRQEREEREEAAGRGCWVG